MSQFISGKISWTDSSSGTRDELGTEIDIYTDSPSFVPNIPVEPASGVSHAWMRLPAVAAGEVSAEFRLETPVTFLRVRVRQYNADGPGEWDVPSGTLFALAQTTGPLAPPAPSAVGFVVTDAVVVPPTPPTDPPPLPPPTGGGGTSSNYTFTSQFSGVQGQNGWSYKDSAGSDLVYSSSNAKWDGDELYLAIWNGGFRHSSSGTLKDCVLRWTAPANGTALVSGTAQLFSTPGSVRFIAKHNATTKFTSTDMTTTTAEPYSFSAVMVAGDTLDFISQHVGTTSSLNNNMLLNPVINFTTDGTTPANPTVSSLSPSSLGVSVGAVQGLTVTLSSAPSSVASVSVSSSDPTKATVPATVSIAAGQLSANIPVTGVAAGSSTITATYNSSNKTAAVTVSNPASSTWANAPAGGTVLCDVNCSADPDTVGLFDVFNSVILETDATAPFSPSGCWKARMEALAPSGGCQLEKTSPTRYREMYFGLYWRSNPQFQGLPVGNKLFFLGSDFGMNGCFTWNNASLVNGVGPMIFNINTSGIANPHVFNGSLDPSLPWRPNVGNGDLARGVWYKLEGYVKASTTRTSQDGILRWWVNDAMVGNYTNVNYCGPNGETLNRWMWTQAWDGSPGYFGNGNTSAWEHWIDHLYVVGKN